jgi:hypothetical protein
MKICVNSNVFPMPKFKSHPKLDEVGVLRDHLGQRVLCNRKRGIISARAYSVKECRTHFY